MADVITVLGVEMVYLIIWLVLLYLLVNIEHVHFMIALLIAFGYISFTMYNDVALFGFDPFIVVSSIIGVMGLGVAISRQMSKKK